MNDENKNFSSDPASQQTSQPAGDVQDPAEPMAVDVSQETESQPAPNEAEVKNTDVAPSASGVEAGLGARPTAVERLEQEEAADKDSDDN